MTIRELFVTALCLGWLVCTAAMAQGVDSPQPITKINHWAGNIAHTNDVAVTGTVQKLLSERKPGTPMGARILLKSEQGVIEANLGPYLPKDVQEGLANGQAVQIVGIPQTSHGKNYLLARQLVFAGRQITIRNEHGFLVRQPRTGSSVHQGQSELNGGNQ